MHFYFLETLPGDFELELFDALKRDSEEYSLLDKVFYLHTPEGMAKSKVAAKVEKVLGVSATARNLRTVNKVIDLVNNMEVTE